MIELDPSLEELAAAYGVATEYWDWRGAHVQVPAHTLMAVLGALGVDASSPSAQADALAHRRDEAWTRMLPRYVVTWAGRDHWVNVHVTHGRPVECGSPSRTAPSAGQLAQAENFSPPPRRWTAGRSARPRSSCRPTCPWATTNSHAYSDGVQTTSPLIVTPAWLRHAEAAREQPDCGG